MSKTPFMVALYLRGDKLNPDAITKRLGVTPDETRRAGEKRFGRQGRVYVNQIGVWQLKAKTDSKILTDHIEEITSKFKKRTKQFENIAGVEEAFIDVFLCFKRTDDSDSYEFSLTKKSIHEIDSLGLPVQFTVSSFEEESPALAAGPAARPGERPSTPARAAARGRTLKAKKRKN